MDQSLIADAYLLGKESIVDFRRLFLPAPNDCASAWFHYEWDKVLRTGKKHFACEAFRESAKALDLNTEIPTPLGFRLMKDLQVGDQVFDENGEVCTITHTSDIFSNHDCYKLTFCDGSSIVADAGHQWYVLNKRARKYQVCTTEEMYGKHILSATKDGYNEFTYLVPLCDEVQYEEKELPIDPYLLGLWLGDGASSKSIISVWNGIIEEVEDRVKSLWHDVKRYPDSGGNYYLSLRDGFLVALKQENLLNNKHIPAKYLQASAQQRLFLLQGLLDTDGTVANKGTKAGTVSFSNTNKRIIDGIYELVCSLGIKATMVEKEAKLNGKDYGKYWLVSFKTTKDVCRLSYKKERLPLEQNQRSLMRTIVNIEKVATVPTKCIRVDSPNHLFLATRNYIPTHNSSLVIRAHTLYRLVYPERSCSFMVIIMANQKSASNRLKDIADEYLNNPYFNMNLVRVKENSEKTFEVIVRNWEGEEIPIRIQAFGKGSAIRGLNNRDLRPQLIIIDDPQDLEDSMSESVTDKDWEWFLSDVIFLGQTSRIFLIGNNLGERCLIERVIAGHKELNFDYSILPILNEKEESNWPSKWPVENILEEKVNWQKLGKIDSWFREKMCIAISPDSQIFKKEYFRYYDPHDLNREDLSIYTTVDLAISEKITADYTVIMTVGVNSDNQWFILDCDFGRWNPTKAMDQLFLAVQKYKPLCVGIEQVAYQAAFRHFLEREMPKRNSFFRIEPLKAENKKEIRISAMQPRFSLGTVWFPQGQTFLGELETELITYPRGRHDDLIDALAYIEQIANPPVSSFAKLGDNDIPFAGVY